MKRTLLGLAAALASMVVLTVAMLPLRGSLSVATTALILVVPVVIGVVIGGFAAGVLSVVAGFLVYDYFFIKPYLTLWVGAPQNWVALGVYVAVMLPVARVVAGMNTARARELRQGRELRRLFELSDLLVEDKPLDVLLSVIVTTLADVFGAQQVALFLPADGRLELVGSAGEPLTAEQLRDVVPEPGSATRHSRERSGLLVLALTASGRPVGLLALSAEATARHEREPLLRTRAHGPLAALAKSLAARSAICSFTRVRRACSRSWTRSTASAIWLANSSRGSRSCRAVASADSASRPTGRPDAVRARTSRPLRSRVWRVAAPGSGTTSRSCSAVRGSPAERTSSRRPSAGRNSATCRAPKTSARAVTMTDRSTSSGLSSTSRSDSSKSRRSSRPWRSSLARAVFSPATTLATGSITATYTPSATQFCGAPTQSVR